MTRLLLVVVAIVVSCTVPHARAAAPAAKSEPAPRVAVRGGLGNFGAKLDGGEPVTVVFVGGSITALPGWRDALTRSWRSRQGDAVATVNAGLSATGSDVAVLRFDDDVLSHDPDLVIVEFAVNDARTAPRTIRRAVEGMIRKVWAADPGSDILFVYLFEPSFMETLSSGQRPQSMVVYEGIAEAHGIPSIDAATVVARLVERGDLAVRGPRKTKAGETPAFGPDGVHPYLRGHRIYARAVERGLASILEASEPRDHAGELTRPVVRDHWQAARKVPLEDWMRDESWRRLTADEAPAVASRNVGLWESTDDGATIEFGFRGEVLKIYEHRPGAPGGLSIDIDGTPLPEAAFRPLKAGPALRVIHVRYDFDRETVHRVRLRVTRAADGRLRPVRIGDLLVVGEVVR